TPSSLLPFDAHNPALLALVSSSVRKSMIHYIAKQVILTVSRVDGEEEENCLTSSTSPQCVEKSLNSETETEPPIKIIPLKRFIANVVRSHDASRLNFPLDTIGRFDIRHRVFLATLIIADKYLNEKYPWNNDWRELLRSLKFNLRFDEAEALRVWQPS
ncbi:hypothetical protein BDQ17DRAFT_1355111, partial [Cyathus striatus]